MIGSQAIQRSHQAQVAMTALLVLASVSDAAFERFTLEWQVVAKDAADHRLQLWELPEAEAPERDIEILTAVLARSEALEG